MKIKDQINAASRRVSDACMHGDQLAHENALAVLRALKKELEERANSIGLTPFEYICKEEK